MRRIDAPSRIKSGKTDRAMIFDDMSELATRFQAGCEASSWGGSWVGYLERETAPKLLREGEESRVAASDAFLNKLEGKFDYASHRFKSENAVAGGVAVVPAYLAGTPLAMRRRRRVEDDLAPIVIIADTTSSEMVNAAHLEKRGAALLALVRLLAGKRPVTLYAGVAMGNFRQKEDGVNAIITRIETAPLDLARAAFLLGNPGCARAIGYGIAVHEWNGTLGHIPWPYNDIDAWRSKAVSHFWQDVFPGSEILYLPPVFGKELEITAPEKWLADMVAKYGGLPNGEED
jgi:hypothetical protein